MKVILDDVSDIRRKELKSIERRIIRQIANILRGNNQVEEDMNNLEYMFKEYYQYYFDNMIVNAKCCEESLERLLRFLLVFPVRYRIDISSIEFLYKKYSLVNFVTYCLYQLCESSVKCSYIRDYLTYIQGSSIEKLTTFYLYRVNPDYVKGNFRCHLVSELTPKEIYYGVTTGYLNIKEKGNGVLERLYDLSAFEEIRQLKSDGFRIVS
ncbi:MAG: hypothetical protein Q4D29_03645 [Lachnospiraceae bacterium]|nr:hypothetical protein [Lachnospiraceae bacterium]